VVGAALKKIAVLLLSDQRVWKRVVLAVLVIIVALFLPAVAVVGIFSGSIQMNVQRLEQTILAALSSEEIAMLQEIEDTMAEIETAMEEAEMPGRVIEAQVLYILALTDQAEQPGFVFRLAGCFYEGQTDAQLIRTVNRVFGTEIEVEEFVDVVKNLRTHYIDTSAYTDPATKNNLDLAQWAIAAEKAGWGYVWGTYGRILTRSLFEMKLEQYPEDVGGYEEYIADNYIGKRTADCVGLIKGYSWYDPQTESFGYAVNGMPDLSANQIYEFASEKGSIDTIPEIPGLLVWMDGHVGIYIGNGEVIEAMGTHYGVVRTQLSRRGWQAWAKVTGITYLEESEEPTEEPTIDPSEVPNVNIENVH
jgi:hypothetical protein